MKEVNRGGLYARYFLAPQPEAGKRLRNRLLEEGIVTKIKKALPKVGRPKKANKLTAAEKQKAYRERRKAG